MFTIRKNLKVIVLWFVSVVIAIGLISLIWFVPQYQVKKARERAAAAIEKLDPNDQPKERLQLEKDLTTAENSARTTIAQILGGLVLLSGLYFTYRNLRVTEEGKLTDRFSKAIEMLGNTNLDVKLGGIYALERLARDSKNDHWTIMEVLTAYVREHSKREKTETQPEAKEGSQESKPPNISTDIQAILEVIFRRKWIASESQSLFLSGADLRGGNFNEADLRRIILSNTNLSGATFIMADLSRADLSGADLSGANLTNANLFWADLSGADLSGAVLTNANLCKAYFFEAKLNGATLILAKLYRADLRRADLNEAVLRFADLSGAENLTWEQVSSAIVDDETTTLPSDLEVKRKASKELLAN